MINTALIEKTLMEEEAEGDMEAMSLMNFPFEKILSVLAVRLFNDESLLSKDISFKINEYCDFGGYKVSSDDIFDAFLEQNVERYLLCTDDSIFSRVRERLSKALGEEMMYIHIYSQVLQNGSSFGEWGSDDQPPVVDFMREHSHDLITHIIKENTYYLDKGHKDYRPGIDKEIEKAIPSLRQFVELVFDNDPDFECSQIGVNIFRSKALGSFLTGDFEGEEADALREAVDGLSFLRKTVCDGVFWGYEEVGYNHVSYEENLPNTTITSHDLARVALIEQLLPKFIKLRKEEEVDASC